MRDGLFIYKYKICWERIKIKNKILLHICCAPDATVPLDDLELEGWDVAGYFYGSNIQPKDEYIKRLEALHILMSEHEDIKVIEGAYKPEQWRTHMESLNLIHEPEGGLRCSECFKLQFEAAAHEAVRLDCTHISTSLTISPHKDVNLIIKIGEDIASKYNLIWLPKIWRKQNGFLRSIKISRELGLYRQNYCGCLPSRASAQT